MIKKIVITRLIIITVFVPGCIDGFMNESGTGSTGIEKSQAVSPTQTFAQGPIRTPAAFLKNDYDKDYYLFLSAEAYDPMGNFEFYLKYYDTISKVNLLSGSVSEIPPP